MQYGSVTGQTLRYNVVFIRTTLPGLSSSHNLVLGTCCTWVLTVNCVLGPTWPLQDQIFLEASASHQTGTQPYPLVQRPHYQVKVNSTRLTHTFQLSGECSARFAFLRSSSAIKITSSLAQTTESSLSL